MAQAQGFLHVDGVEVFNNYRTWVALGCGSIPGVTVHSVAEPCRGFVVLHDAGEEQNLLLCGSDVAFHAPSIATTTRRHESRIRRGVV